jgi:hypothetical protein
LITSRPAGDAEVESRTRPGDECPWPRPFPAGFILCPLFEAREFVPVDLNLRPLKPVITCAHLVTEKLPDRVGGWYGACGIGNAAARLRFAFRAESPSLPGSP